MFNAGKGFIIGVANFSPYTEVKKALPSDSDLCLEHLLPEVNHWSDVVANLYAESAGTLAPSGLNNVIRQNIVGQETINLIKQVFAEHPQRKIRKIEI